MTESEKPQTPAAPAVPEGQPATSDAEEGSEVDAGSFEEFLATEGGSGDEETAESEGKPTPKEKVPAAEEIPSSAVDELASEGKATPSTPPTPEGQPMPTPAAAQPGQPTPGEPTTPTPEPQALTPEQVAESFKKFRNEGIEILAEHHYKLSPEQVKELADPDSGMVTPERVGKLASRLVSQVYMDVVTAAMAQVTQHMPVLIDRVIEARRESTKREEAFYKAWPALAPHRADVIRIARTYRAQNPNVSAEQFIKEVGATAMVALRLGMPAAPTGAQTLAPQPAPFRPATTGRVSAGPTPKAPSNPFADMIEQELREEMDEEE